MSKDAAERPQPSEERPAPTARSELFARLRPWEAAALLDWLAAEVRRGEIATEIDGAPVRFPLEAPLRLRISAERRTSGGQLRLRLYWETADHGPIEIDPS